jgi:serine/threonine protein kinase
VSVQPTPARTVGDYQLLARLGEGGMGVVHLARKPGGDRVALKVLRPHIVGDHEARSRLAREVNSLSRIRSRWVAEIVDADPWADIPFVATRYVPGLSLNDHVAEEGPIAAEDLWWFARCLADGLASVHEVGVLHRDVKPSNVLMEGRTPILIDFGLARVADDPKLTHTGWLLGTPGYLAPEILHGDDATAASDVHSWAATVAFAATGNPPFGRGPSMAIMDRVRRGEHDLTGLPDRLRDLVSAALDPEPARRPTLARIRELLSTPTSPPPVHAVTEDDDPFTLPLALAAHDDQQAPTLIPPRHAPLLPSYPAPVSPVPSPSDTRWLTDEVDLSPATERAGPPVRRGILLVSSALLAGAVVAAWPYPAVALILLASWLLRSGTMLASAHGDRRRLRGAKWYDVVLAPLSAPWYLLSAVPGAVLLTLWAAGLAVAGALVCYAFGASTAATLFVSGTCLATSLWLGPGGAQVRWPLRLVTQPLARRTGRWAVVVVLVLGLTGVVGQVASAHVSWAPFGDPTHSDR